jgi:hypothetical protein
MQLPKTASDYRAHAGECERLAEKARGPETRKIMTYLTLRWRELAERAEVEKTPLKPEDRPLSPSS